MMARKYFMLLLFISAAVISSGQVNSGNLSKGQLSTGEETAQQPDSVLIITKNIFDDLSGTGPAGNRITISNPRGMEQMLLRHWEYSSQKKVQGFRVRIYFDNRQQARSRSSEVESHFAESYPGVPVYRTYTYPYFKVTVGDFRTRSEAMMFLRKIELDFPSAFIVRESINFPALRSFSASPL
ncbi:MAG: SPOR domain-containing protein [Bacteroidales bacterium]|nr:SPOR domain-containing protein [Bacteroidales bacterium]